ncbi:unnamed protein product [Cylindrotheca closterium]|uniref:Ankyrin repeat protein n=1 Tax=Cylindrotheca closterium TaxID=2856 RepID=A0AAD2FK80_9STRA|nr:unnamed protein product [Cylindrotheca closterium]
MKELADSHRTTFASLMQRSTVMSIFDAVRTGNGILVGELIDKNDGVDVHESDDEGETALHIACRKGNYALIKMLLLAYGADVNTFSGPNNNQRRMTCLHCASKNQYPEIVLLLLKHGADIEARDEDGWRPMHYACRLNHLDIVRVLIEQGAQLEAPGGGSRSTPLHLACQYGKSRLVRLLLRKGANAKTRNAENLGPLQLAAASNHPETVWALIRNCPWLVAVLR